MSRRVLKWQVPVDDRDHPIGGGPVVLVACQNDNAALVQVWTDEANAGDVADLRSARVFGTGQPILRTDEHIGSVVVGPLVWHVFASTRKPAPLGAAS